MDTTRLSLLALLLFATCSSRPLGVSQGGPFESYDDSNGLGTRQAGSSSGNRAGTNPLLDQQNPVNFLEPQTTDGGTVPNLKWSFSLSKTKFFSGGFQREQVSQDLPSGTTLATSQLHLRRGSIRELHWHRTAEWGIVNNGSVLVSIVDENGNFQAEMLGFGDVWYFPRGVAHSVQGVDDENELFVAFDDPDFDRTGTTFNIDDWIAHTPKDVLAKNFGLPQSVFDETPMTDPVVLNGTLGAPDDQTVTPLPPSSTEGQPLMGNASFVHRTLAQPGSFIASGGGTVHIIDSTNFPAAKTIAAAYLTLKPHALREMHWHPSGEEIAYCHSGQGRATVFMGTGNARTFDLGPGDILILPDNSGHYIENTSGTDDMIIVALYKADKVIDVSLRQWLALTPPEMAAQTLKVDINVIRQLTKEKQVIVT